MAPVQLGERALVVRADRERERGVVGRASLRLRHRRTRVRTTDHLRCSGPIAGMDDLGFARVAPPAERDLAGAAARRWWPSTRPTAVPARMERRARPIRLRRAALARTLGSRRRSRSSRSRSTRSCASSNVPRPLNPIGIGWAGPTLLVAGTEAQQQRVAARDPRRLRDLVPAVQRARTRAATSRRCRPEPTATARSTS